MFRRDDLKQYSDTLRTRSGEAVTVRFAEPRDAEELQNYYRSLSAQSRYNRFLGAMSELPKAVLDDFTDVGREGGFTVVAAMQVDGFEIIVGEARYVFHAESGSVEFGLSVDDYWQGQGIGASLLKNLECRAAALRGAGMFGDTLRSNKAMVALARRSGFAIGSHPDDWKLLRIEKAIDVEPRDIPCASWRLAAEAGQFAAA
jgi:GNAT superfamily N-acetyltransferase